jgi:radical SAM superfamily enzyme YgiQ (UPF0313 family)
MLNISMVDLGTGGNSGLLPLGSALVGEYAKKVVVHAGFEVSMNYYLFWPTNEDFQEIIKSDAVCFATYVWNIKNSLQLASIIKAANKKVQIIFGGYSVPKPSNGAHEFLLEYPQIDYLVHGEGERSFSELILAFAKKTSCDSIAVSYIDSGVAKIAIANQDRSVDLDEIPSPFLNGTFENILKKYGNKITGTLWETDRGCPFSCTFCDWGDSAVQKIKKYSVERLKAEINWIGRNKINYIFNCNANFGILYERDLEIAQAIAITKKETGFPNFFTTNWTKNSHEKILTIAEVLSKEGIHGDITLSVQSLHTPTLKAIKRVNLPDQKLLALKKLFHDKKVPTYTELILPLPLETLDSVRNSLSVLMCFEEYSHFIFYPCSILVNTEMSAPEYLKKYEIVTASNVVPVARKGSGLFIDKEEDLLVVSTSTMSLEEHREAFILMTFAQIMYNHRTLFYLLKYLDQIGLSSIAVLDDIKTFAKNNVSVISNLLGGLYSRVDAQFTSILSGNGATSALRNGNDVNFYAHELGLVMMLEQIETLKLEITEFLLTYKKAGLLNTTQFKHTLEILDFNLFLLPTGNWGEKVIRLSDFQREFFYPNSVNPNTKVVQSRVCNSTEEFQQHYSTILRGGRRITLNNVFID